MSDPLLDRPCDFGRHQEAATCDCRICGWHVWDTPSEKDGSGRVIIDGSLCINGRPRAVDYRG